MLAQSFEDQFRDWAIDGYGSYVLFLAVVLVIVFLALRGTRSKY